MRCFKQNLLPDTNHHVRLFTFGKSGNWNRSEMDTLMKELFGIQMPDSLDTS